MKSPTQRTMEQLRRSGWTPALAERWNPYARIRQDLFGIGDVLAIRPDSPVLMIQCTTGDNMHARRIKALAEPRLKIWLQSGQKFELWGWVKRGGKWEAKRQPLVLADFEAERVDGATVIPCQTRPFSTKTSVPGTVSSSPASVNGIIATPLDTTTTPIPAPQTVVSGTEARGLTVDAPDIPTPTPAPPEKELP